MEERDVFEQLDSLLGGVNLKDVTADSDGDFPKLQDGYYPCVVERATLGVSKKGDAMVKFMLSVNGDGITDDGDMRSIPHVNNRKVFVNFMLNSENNIRKFTRSMLMFENEEGPLFTTDYFKTTETIKAVLDVVAQYRLGIYIHLETSEKENDDGTFSQWPSFVSWKRATELGLPM